MVVSLNQKPSAGNHNEEFATQLRQIPSLCHLSDVVINQFGETALCKKIPAGEMAFSAGQYEAEDIYCCIRGDGHITRSDAQNGSIYRQPVSEGDVIGLDYVLASFTEQTAAMSMQAVSDMEFLLVDSDQVRRAIADDHQTAIILLREMARAAIGSAIETYNVETSAAKISRILSAMAYKDDNEAEWRIDTMPRHKELAAQAEVSEKQAAEIIARLIGMQILKRDYPGVIITNYAGLMSYAG